MKITRSQLRKLINETYYESGYQPTPAELKVAGGDFDFGEFPTFTGPEKYRHDSSVRKNIPGMNISLRGLIDKAKQHPDYPAGSKIARTFEGLKYLVAGNREPDELDWDSFTNLMRFQMRDYDRSIANPAVRLNNILAMMMT